MERSFNLMPSADIQRSKFDRGSWHKTSMKLGDIVPIYTDVVYPGDTVKFPVASLIRMSTPIAPIMDDIVMEYFAFFVPNRLLWKNWKRFMGESNTAGYEENELLAPMDKVGETAETRYIEPGSLLDYIGIQSPSLISREVEFSSFPLRAYIKIYNRWFRNQNVEGPIYENDTDNGCGTTPYNIHGDLYSNSVTNLTKNIGTLKPFVAYKKPDYFTSALPYAQKGAPVTLPLGSYAPVITTDDENKMVTITASTPNVSFGNKSGTTWSDYSAYLGLASGDVTGGPGLYASMLNGNDDALRIPGEGSDGFVVPNNFIADLSKATAATINTIRLAFQTQKLLERDALYGSRYAEILYGHFGVRSPDASLQDPEYLGRIKFYINVDQVLQTTGATGTDAQTLGTPGANSVTGNNGTLCTKSFTEHGIFMVLAVARQKIHTYGQGINRIWTNKKRLDYMWPEFVNCGLQEIKYKEIYLSADSSLEDEYDPEGTFGFAERYIELRTRPSQVSGILNPNQASSLDYWTLADKFEECPTLGETFLKEDRSALSRALVTGSDGPDFICDFLFPAVWVRPIPMYGIPGFIDHH